MRLILSLRSKCEAVYNTEYNHFFQAFLYDLLKNTIFDWLHLKHGYKFFCFSNIFPVADLKNGDIRNIIISSPSQDLINILKEKLQQTETIKIGNMIFQLIKTKKINPKIKGTSAHLVTGTPIIIRIPRKKAEKIGIPIKKHYDYIYWRFNMPLSLFTEQLEANLIKKWSEYYGQPPPEESLPLLNSHQIILKPMKEVSTRIHYKTGRQIIIGTTWKLWLRHLNKQQKKLLNFAIETGLGEMNPQGFGFINIENKEVID